MRKLNIVSKASVVAAIAAPLALTGPAAFATDTECLTAEQHETVTTQVADYLAQRAAASNALASAQAELADAETALTDARSQADSLAAQVRDASARKNAALAEIATRQGYIAGFQAKLPIWQGKLEAALDRIGKAQRDYRTAKNAGDQAGMDAAHAAAEAARVDKAAAEAQVEHYGSASQQNQRNRIAKLQSTVDEMTAIGKSLYPQYQKTQARIPGLVAARDAAADAVTARQNDVISAGDLLSDAEAQAALPVCETEPAPEYPTGGHQPTGPTYPTGGHQPTGPAATPVVATGGTGSTGECDNAVTPTSAPATTTRPAPALASPAVVTPVAAPAITSAEPTPADQPETVTMELAAGDDADSSSVLWAGVAVGVLVAAGAVGGGVAYARKR